MYLWPIAALIFCSFFCCCGTEDDHLPHATFDQRQGHAHWLGLNMEQIQIAKIQFSISDFVKYISVVH